MDRTKRTHRREPEAPAPAVRFEVCAEFRLDPDCPWCACTTCGRLADNHGLEPVLRRAS
jgi:hypothetical protein